MFNSAKANVFEGISMIYVPQDSSFQNFKQLNVGSAGNYIPISHRLCVYGKSLPNSTTPSMNPLTISICKVYATIPFPKYQRVVEMKNDVNQVSTKFLEQVSLKYLFFRLTDSLMLVG